MVASRSGAGTRSRTSCSSYASKIAGLKPPQVKLHIVKAGGSFGRRAVADAEIVAEAVMISKALDYRAPVKVQWTREDDMAGGR
jgi:isoquinoline 1-oxidoreductase beta subunit